MRNMRTKYEEAIKLANKKLSGDTLVKDAMGSLYNKLSSDLYKVASVVSSALDSGMDIFLKDESIKIDSLSDLYAFDSTGDNKLVHKSTKDLWSVEALDDGTVVINRLFDQTGKPIKG